MNVRVVAALACALFSAAAYGQGAVKGDPAKAQQIVTQVARGKGPTIQCRQSSATRPS